MYTDKLVRIVKQLSAISIFFFILFFALALSHHAYANSYTECETGISDACTAKYGKITGHITYVTNNNGSYQCQDLGQYQCNRPYWGTCGGGGADICWAGLTGSKPPVDSSQFSGPFHIGIDTGESCVKEAGTFGINNNLSKPDLYCVCGVPGAAACPATTPSTSPVTPVSVSPTSSVTPPSPTASVNLVIGLPGIGKITGPVGVLPQHTTRTVTVELYDASVTNPSGPGTKSLTKTTGTVTYDNGTDNNAGYFVSTTPLTVTLPATPPTNNEYEILVEMPQYLYELAIPTTQADSSNPNAFVITTGTTVSMNPLSLFPGDVVGVNSMGIDDYTQIKTCFDNISDTTCTKTTDGILYADLNDNGQIDLVDFNLFLRSIFQLAQHSPSPCNGLTCQGD